jgi:trans-aconitate methyltransferase
VSAFSAEWLALREPADWRSRSARVTNAVVHALPKGRVVRAVDLAAGTGSNTRFLKRTLTPPQEWLLVDHDPDLLERAQQTIGSDIRTHAMDLSHTGELATVLQGQEMVTASALLDLVSEEWLQALCAMCRSQRSVVLFALSYDGRMTSLPEEPEDELVRTLVNRHQQTDKGFGRALGPDAAARATELLENLGYQVVRDRSDWVLDRESALLQRQLIDGWAEAATAIAPAEAEIIGRWRERRIEHIAGERSRVIVGHEDLGAFIA